MVRVSNPNVRRRAFLQKAGAGAAVASLAGCLGDAGSGTPTVRFIHTKDERQTEILNGLISDYEENNGVEIETTSTNHQDVMQQVSQAAAGNDPYDVIDATQMGYAATLRDEGIIQPVDDLIEEMGGSDHFFENMLLPFDDGLYLIPQQTTVVHQIYRKDLFKEYDAPEPPFTNWDDFLEATAQVTDPDENLYGHPLYAGNWFVGAWIISILNSNGGHVVNSDDEIAFDSPETVEMMEMFQDLSEYSPESAFTADIPEMRPPLYQGQVAQIYYSSNLIPLDAEEMNPDLLEPDLGDNVWIAPLPSNNGNDPVLRSQNSGSLLASNPEHSEETREFLKELHSVEWTAEILKASPLGQLPTIHGLLQDDSPLWENDTFNEYEDLFARNVEILEDYGRVLEFAENPGHISPVSGRAISEGHLADCLQDMLINDLGPEESVKKWADIMREDFSSDLA